MFLNVDDKKLRAEAEAFAAMRRHSSEHERVQAMEGIEAHQRGVDEEQADFKLFQRTQREARAYQKFLSSFPQFQNYTENVVSLDTWLKERGLYVTFENLQQAYADLSSQHALILDTTKRARSFQPENLDDLTTEELFDRQQKAEEAENVETEADAAEFSRSAAARAATKFVRLHPEWIQCPENMAAFQLYFNTHKIIFSQASLGQLNAAFEELHGQLKLDQSKQPAQSDNFDPENCSMKELAEKCGGLEKPDRDTYVPNPAARYGSHGQQF